MRSYWSLLLLLASMWGASYLFIKVAVDGIPPAALGGLVLILAGVTLASGERIPRPRDQSEAACAS